MDVHGNCEAPFKKVKQVFLQHFEEDQEKGGALSIWYKGELVVNLWAGYRDKAQKKPWTEQTIVNIFSTSKMISAICVQHAIDQGALDITRPIKDYWNAFNSEGKGETTMAWLLNHRAGLPALREPVPGEALFDWDYMCARLAKERPWWKPGEQHGYHMVTFGWLVGEVFKRAVGITLGQYLKEQIVERYHFNMAMGLDESQHEIADLFGATATPAGGRIHLLNEVMANPDGMTAKALSNPPTLLTSSNKPEWRATELPSANCHSSAASLATLMGVCLSGGGLLSDQALERLLTEESQGFDPVLTTETRFGPGVMLQYPGHAEASFGNLKRGFGHPGSGGSLAFADPDNQVGFAYVMNQMGPYVMVDPRPRLLADTFYHCLLGI